MENEIVVGMNRTGLDMAPLSRDLMISYAQGEADRAPETDGAFEAVHLRYIEEAERVGSVPIPATVKGMAKTAASKVAGRNPEVLIDKLGERMAFERAGTRLYEAMLLKCGAVDAANNPIDVAALARIRDDEEMHFHLVHKFIERLGADPTAMTPCADIVGVQGMGLMQVISDPRTTVAQALNALMTAELTDNASWELLIELAGQSGQKEMATEFAAALQAEQQHLDMVRGWLRQAVLGEAK
jgi:ferritin-like metal-binding protein YciE